ncbi:Acyl-CoA dehydrogenase [Sphingobium sp. AP50]|uniref:acyl-CoA dehydrogenase family protein n=1 Tax=Sphingobium sp. AP50 TaxID=1884369 RepID=UPI0008B0B2B9|nr:acyl-CoA dehydrogenase family protein [Sphingobium sp. AP50]SEJ66114.1 Acyl-CoA dehydrogenase [Sphingobium sp. AP50]
MAVLSEEQMMLREMAREWVDNESPVSAFRSLRDHRAGGLDFAKWHAMGEMGWTGIVIGEEFGGTDFGYTSLGIVTEQLGRNLVAVPLGSSSVAGSAIRLGQSEEAKRTWLPRLAGAEAIAALAIDEGPTHNMRFRTTVHDGKLTGVKAFVADGSAADIFIVSAEDGLYLVEKAKGVISSAREIVDSRDHVQVRFEEAPAVLLGGPLLTATVVNYSAAVTAAEMLGMAESAFGQTLAYLKQRVQFGKLLSSFQALQHRMAQMFTELELTRSAVEDALQAIDEERSGLDLATSLAKALAGETLKRVTREMLQLFGGVGMTDEYDVGLYLKRAAVLEAMWGNASYHRDRFGRLNGY